MAKGKRTKSDNVENPETPDLDQETDQPQQDHDEMAASDEPEDPSADSGGLDAASVEAEQAEAFEEAGVSDDMAALRDMMEAALLKQSGELDVEAKNVSGTVGKGIVGVGIGLGDVDSAAGGFLEPGMPSLTLFTESKLPEEELAAQLASIAGTKALSSMPIEQVTVGSVEAFSHRRRHRPAPGGVSVGHVDVTAGTLGARVSGLSGPWHNRHLVLSNNHVLANSNAGRVGDSIIQQGRVDGGRHPADQVAILSRWVPIRFGGAPNVVDCAYGWAWHQRIRGGQYYRRNGQDAHYQTGTRPIAPRLGMVVGKSGRTTGLTQGRVSQIGVSVNVNFGQGRIAMFRNQIAIRSVNSQPFSAGGDSGSMIWEWQRSVRPVGLLFAGGGGTTFANPMGAVLGALNVRII